MQDSEIANFYFFNRIDVELALGQEKDKATETNGR
jgi:hypothetical protein